MAQWWGSKGFKSDVKTLDLKPGGTFHYRMLSPLTCEEAMTTYAKVLGGEIVAMLPYGEMPGDHPIPDDMRKKIAHARIMIGNEVLMASDAGPDNFKSMQGVSVTLNIPEPDEADRVSKRSAKAEPRSCQ